MTIHDWMGLFGVLIAFCGILFGIFKYYDGRISAVFRRFDDHKKFTDENFVRITTCKILHDASEGNTGRLERRLDKVDEKLDILIRNGHER
jgi:hypothetical protein